MFVVCVDLISSGHLSPPPAGLVHEDVPMPHSPVHAVCSHTRCLGLNASLPQDLVEEDVALPRFSVHTVLFTHPTFERC